MCAVNEASLSIAGSLGWRAMVALILRISCIAMGLSMLTLAGSFADGSRLDNDAFDVREQRWIQTLDSIEQDLARDGILRSQITPLRDDLTTVQDSVLIVRDRAARDVDEQQRLLDALGSVEIHDFQ